MLGHIIEHRQACQHGQLEKLVLVEHLMANDDHVVKLEEMKILSCMLHYYVWLTRK